MTRWGSAFILAIAAAMGIAITLVIAGCGVKAPPRPPLPEAPPAARATAPGQESRPVPPSTAATPPADPIQPPPADRPR